MRYAIAALALAGAAMAGEGYAAYPKDDPKYDPAYPSKDGGKGDKDSYDPAYPTDKKDADYPKYTYDTAYGTDYPTDYPHDYPSTKTYDPSYPTYDPAYPTYPVTTKKDDASYPTTTPCSTDKDYNGKDKYPVTSKKYDDYDHDHEYEHGDKKKYTTETIYTTKTYTAKHGDKDVETQTYVPITTTVYPVGEKYPTKQKEDKEDKDYKPSKPSQYETKKYEAEKPTACPSYSVKTIHTSITTVVPTVIYETVAVPCPTGKPVPTGGYPSKNGTSPKYPPVTAGSASLAASGLAAFAGLVAFVFL
jgi:hypothetical protein